LKKNGGALQWKGRGQRDWQYFPLMGSNGTGKFQTTDLISRKNGAKKKLIRGGRQRGKKINLLGGPHEGVYA